jgi:hypothetical protein
MLPHNFIADAHMVLLIISIVVETIAIVIAVMSMRER